MRAATAMNIEAAYRRVLEGVRRGKLDHLTPEDWDTYKMVLEMKALEETDG